jgi:hypothetical protein
VRAELVTLLHLQGEEASLILLAGAGEEMSTGSLGMEDVWHARRMTLRAGMPVLRLVARLHVDLLRVSSAACLPAA